MIYTCYSNCCVWLVSHKSQKLIYSLVCLIIFVVAVTSLAHSLFLCFFLFVCVLTVVRTFYCWIIIRTFAHRSFTWKYDGVLSSSSSSSTTTTYHGCCCCCYCCRLSLTKGMPSINKLMILMIMNEWRRQKQCVKSHSECRKSRPKER